MCYRKNNLAVDTHKNQQVRSLELRYHAIHFNHRTDANV